jgi:hypothetical protein
MRRYKSMAEQREAVIPPPLTPPHKGRRIPSPLFSGGIFLERLGWLDRNRIPLPLVGRVRGGGICRPPRW